MKNTFKNFLASLLCTGLFFSSGSMIQASETNPTPIAENPYTIYSESDLYDPQLFASPEEMGIQPENVIANDNRQPVTNTKAYPYSAICKLVITFENNGRDLMFIGTGFLVDNNKVLTAGHCIYEAQYGMAKSILVVPGAGSDGSEPFGSELVTTENMNVTDLWKETSKTDWDFGVLTLKSDFGSKAGVLKLAESPASHIGTNLKLAGYPYNAGDDISKLPQMFDVDLVKSLGTNKVRTIYHEIDSGAGQSGSPILNAGNEVVGIHTFALSNRPLNGGVLVDAYIRDFIEESESPDVPIVTDPQGSSPVYRLYNRNSGEHFYTPSLNEATFLVSAGWEDEGKAWNSTENGVPIYRVYNPNAGDHHYTLNKNEVTTLVSLGWNDEGIAWYGSPNEEATAVYRLYNPNAKAGAHHFTMNRNERDRLIDSGWQYEGIAFRTN